MPPVGARPPGHPRDVALRDNSEPSYSFLDAAARTAEHGNGTFRRAAKERSWSAQSPRRRSTPDPSSGFWNAILAYSAGAPTVSAIAAPRPPRGLSPWTVLSFAVWCSISALSSAPNKITIAEIHIHIIGPIAAPSDP